MRLGIKTPLHRTSWSSIEATWQFADRSPRIASAWVFDHLEPVWGKGAGACFDPWTTLGGLAHATRRLRIGILASPAYLRHPVLVAQMMATLQAVSSGRFELGLGTGGTPEEARRAGIEVSARHFDRLEQLRETWTVLHSLLRGPTQHEGQHWSVPASAGYRETLGELSPPAVLIAGSGAKLLALAAELGADWACPTVEPALFTAARRTLQAQCFQRGRPLPSCIAHTILQPDTNERQLVQLILRWRECEPDQLVVALPVPYGPDHVQRLAEASERAAAS